MKSKNEKRTNDDVLLNEYDIAVLLELSVSTIRRWRRTQKGPKYLKLGSTVRYRESDLTRWLESCPCGGSQW